uniref:hypothetical protein n=1 Tax=Streptomyces bacillaris TaxID=68179 RepID=UPI00296F7AC9
MPEQAVDQFRDPRQGPPLVLQPAVRRRSRLQLGLQLFCLGIVESARKAAGPLEARAALPPWRQAVCQA